MFGAKGFILQAAVIWIFISVVLVESARHKKDVHHMIILNEEIRPSTSHRPKHHSHSSRSNRRPSQKSKPKPPVSSYSSEESSFEITEEDENSNESSYLYRKPKSKRPSHHHKPSASAHHKTSKRHHKHHSNHKKNHKSDYHRDNTQNHHHHHSEHQTLPSNWVPIPTKELFGSQPPSAFSGGYPTGAMHYPHHQTVPMEITTPFAMPNNFINLASTLYPPLEMNNQFSPIAGPMAPMVGAVEAYKPFDYSVLEQNNNVKSAQKYAEEDAQGKGVEDQHVAASNGGTGFSIVIDNSDEYEEKRKKEANIKDSNIKKGRGSGRHRIKKKH